MFENAPDPPRFFVAIVSNQLHQRILGTMYFKLKKRKYNFKFFKTEVRAMVWLEDAA